MDINELRRRAGLNEYFHFDGQSNKGDGIAPQKGSEQFMKAVQQVKAAMDIMSKYHHYGNLSQDEMAILEEAFLIIGRLAKDGISTKQHKMRGFDGEYS